MKYLKRTMGVLSILSCALIVFFRLSFGTFFQVKEVGVVGIIGGADGPTAIYHTTSIVSYYKYALFAALIFFIIWLVLHIKSKK